MTNGHHFYFYIKFRPNLILHSECKEECTEFNILCVLFYLFIFLYFVLYEIPITSSVML